MLSVGCARPIPTPPPPPPAPPAEVFVHPKGDDRDPGTADAPFRTLPRALAAKKPVIRVHPAVHEVGRLFITRPVKVVATSTGVTLKGSIFINTSDTTLEGLTIDGELEAVRSPALTLTELTIRTEEQEDALSLVDTTGRLADVRIGCGGETCLQITTSTIVADGLNLDAATNTKRGLRVTSSQVEVENLTIRGTKIAQVQAEERARITVRQGTLEEAGGSAIVAVLNSTVNLDQVTTTTAAQSALLAQSSTVIATGCRFGASRTESLNISGAVVRLTDCTVTGGPNGAANLKAFENTRGQLHLRNCTVVHRDYDGVLGSASLLEAIDSRFLGRPGPGGGHAISMRGPRSEVILSNAQILAPAGLGLEITEDASARLSGAIVAPGQGGVVISHVIGGDVVIDGLTIENCASGSAVKIVDSVDVKIRQSRFEGCPQAGILAVERSSADVQMTMVRRNNVYGMAAFGATELAVSSSTVSGGRWSTFSACSDDSIIFTGRQVRIEGRAGACL